MNDAATSPPEPEITDLESRTVRFLRRRSWLNPDLRMVTWDGGPAVAKDWGSAPWWLRPYGRWSLRREWRILTRVAGIDGVPGPVARLPDAIVMSLLEGTPLSSRLASALPPDFFARMEEMLAEIHARGVVHLDLRQRQNVQLGEDRRPQILDFGAGIDLGRLGWFGRFGLGWLRSLDRIALLKLKGKYAADQLTPAERRRAAWARRMRYLWPPNGLHVVKTRIRRLWRGRSTGGE